MNNKTLFVITLLLALVSFSAQSADYTLRSLTEGIIGWGRDNVDVSEMKWQRASEEFSSNFLGSTVTFTALVDPKKIEYVRGGDATIRADSVAYQVILYQSIPYTASRSRYESTNQQAGDLNLQGIWKDGEKIRCTEAYELCEVNGIAIVLNDTSHNMAFELVGETKISGTGRVMRVGTSKKNRFIGLEIEVINWSKN